MNSIQGKPSPMPPGGCGGPEHKPTIGDPSIICGGPKNEPFQDKIKDLLGIGKEEQKPYINNIK